ECHGLLCDVLGDAFHLVEAAAHLHHRDPFLDVALAVAHAGLGRLLGDGLVGEDADPDLAAALDEAGHRDAAGLDLARGEAPRLEHLEAVVAESEIAPAVGLALVAALHLLAVLGARWLKHRLSLPTARGSASRPTSGSARALPGAGSPSPRSLPREAP